MSAEPTAPGGPGAVTVAALAIAFAAASVAFGAVGLGAWESVVHYTPPFHFADSDAVEGPHITHRVVLVVIDGLRLDRSRRMAGLNNLRVQGADFDAVCGIPSYSRPGRANLATGASPEVHGITTNRKPGPLLTDNLFRETHRIGGTVAVAGTTIWRDLFGPDLVGAAMMETDLGKQHQPFASIETPLLTFDHRAARFIAAQGARLAVLDLILPDEAAHESGAQSPTYARACIETDRTLALLASELNLYTTTLVVTADHGHRNEGGHGGVEPEVLQVPLVMVGRGIRAISGLTAQQVDVAPTIAALLGVPTPAGSEGRPLVEAFDTKDDNVASVWLRAMAQKQAFARQYLAGLGESVGVPSPPSDPAAAPAYLDAVDRALDDARHVRREADSRARLPIAAVALLVPIGLVAWTARRHLLVALICAVAAAALSNALFVWLLEIRHVALSSSAINQEQNLHPYFGGIMVSSAISLVVVVGLLVTGVRLARPSLSRVDLATIGFATALGVCLWPGVAVAADYWHQGMRMTWTIGNFKQSFKALVGLTRMLGAACGSALFVPAFAWLLSRLPRPSGV